jgi:hypothetical protein
VHRGVDLGHIAVCSNNALFFVSVSGMCPCLGCACIYDIFMSWVRHVWDVPVSGMRLCLGWCSHDWDMPVICIYVWGVPATRIGPCFVLCSSLLCMGVHGWGSGSRSVRIPHPHTECRWIYIIFISCLLTRLGILLAYGGPTYD